MDSSQWPSLSEWDPEFKKTFEANPISFPPITDAAQLPPTRSGMAVAMKDSLYSQVDFTGVEQSAIDIPARDGTKLTSLVFKPSTPHKDGGPLAVLYHGGGWVVGMAEMEVAAAVSLVKGFGATVISVEYRLAPEHPFPIPVNDSWDALKWCAANAGLLGANPSQGFLMGGSSAGGNIVAVLQHLARDENLSPPVTGVWLGYPVTLSLDAVPEKFASEFTSYHQNAEAPILTKQAMIVNRTFYQPDPQSELLSPLLWPSGHAKLPKTYVQVCGLDPLRDDGLLYEREIRKDGVATKLDVYPGVPHAFDIMFPQLAATQKFNKDRVAGFKWLLEGN